MFDEQKYDIIVIGAGHALKIVDIFLDTDFEGGRHARRVELISKIEETNN